MMARQAVIMLLLLAQSGQNRKFLYLKISVKQSGAGEHSLQVQDHLRDFQLSFMLQGNSFSVSLWHEGDLL